MRPRRLELQGFNPLSINHHDRGRQPSSHTYPPPLRLVSRWVQFLDRGGFLFLRLCLASLVNSARCECVDNREQGPRMQGVGAHYECSSRILQFDMVQIRGS